MQQLPAELLAALSNQKGKTVFQTKMQVDDDRNNRGAPNLTENTISELIRDVHERADKEKQKKKKQREEKALELAGGRRGVG